MKKKIIGSLIAATTVLGIWYFFLKPGDYQVSFTANTFPGAINQTIKVWGKERFLGKIVSQKDLYTIQQQFQFGDSIVDYHWNIKRLTDSTSRVKIQITDRQNSWKNRLFIPFSKTVLEKRSKKVLLNYTDYLNYHTKRFKVNVVGQDTVPPSFCAYLEVEGIQRDKAFGMMRDFPFLSGYVEEQGMVTYGVPFVEIIEWNQKNDSIRYNFCYPVKKPDSIPKHDEIKFKGFERRVAVKAVYNGNYITSDRAWYKLMDYAKKEGLQITGNPIEVFYDNPATNGNELSWKAEIYMPLLENAK